MANALLGLLGVVLAILLTLLVSMLWDVKKNVGKIFDILNVKQDKPECTRIMEKLEKDLKEILTIRRLDREAGK